MHTTDSFNKSYSVTETSLHYFICLIGTMNFVNEKFNLSISIHERELMDLFYAVNQYHKLDCTVRLCGGWVRDKVASIFGYEKNTALTPDIDVVLDTLSAREYVEKVKTYIDTLDGKDIALSERSDSRLQTRHLDIKTIFVYGFTVDFTSFRKETYTDSRIPLVTTGTVYDDVLRRDFTINALYYNCSTQCLEDHTEKGIEDIRHRVLRSPQCNAMNTIMQDPLRLLRLIRFCCTLGYTPHWSLLGTMYHPSTHEALKTKISRERIGVEIEKSLQANPLQACKLLVSNNLASVVFAPPSISTKDYRPFFVEGLKRVQLLQSLCSMVLHAKNERVNTHLFLACFLSPLCYEKYVEENKEKSLVEYILRCSLKFSIQSTLKTMNYMKESLLLQHSKTMDTIYTSRKELGLVLLRFAHSWKTIALLSLSYTHYKDSYWQIDCVNELQQKLLEKYRCFCEGVLRNGLDKKTSFEPPLKVLDVCSLVHRKPGSWLKNIKQLLIEWTLENPESTVEECKNYVLSIKDM